MLRQLPLARMYHSSSATALSPQLKTLGPKYGKQLNAIREYLSTADGNKIVDAVSDGKTFTFDAGGIVEVTEEDLLIEPVQKAGFAAESDGDLSVIMDTNLTPELISEGYVRGTDLQDSDDAEGSRI